MDNYTSVTNNKILLHTADVAVEEKPEYLIISPIESNVEAQNQIKPIKTSERYKLLAKTRVQRKKLYKKDEAYMNVEVNILQQRFNKIELEKDKEKKFCKRNSKKDKSMRRIKVTNAMKLIKKFKAHLIGISVLIKHLRNSIKDYLYLLFTRKSKYIMKIIH